MTETNNTNNIEIGDLWYILKAIEIAGSKNAYNELEVKSFKPSFDRVHQFLIRYQEALKADAEKQAAATAATTPETGAVAVDPVEGVTKVNVKPKAKVAAKKKKGA